MQKLIQLNNKRKTVKIQRNMDIRNKKYSVTVYPVYKNLQK